MTRLTLTGKTFGIKDELKAQGFKWNSYTKVWYKDFDDADRAQALATAYESNGVYGSTEKVVVKHYPVKESWIFNLESMHDKIWCLVYDIRENKIVLPFEVAGKTINSEDDLFELQDEAANLCSKAWRGVTGKEYGRIREIVTWRVNARYARCVASGMNEADAGLCFEDM